MEKQSRNISGKLKQEFENEYRKIKEEYEAKHGAVNNDNSEKQNNQVKGFVFESVAPMRTLY